MTTRKAALFAGSMLFTLVGASVAAAADNTPPPAPAVVVTGTRIPRPNLDQPVPVETVSQQIIQNAATPDLGQVIASLPSMGPQGTIRANSNEFGNTGGLSFADLRNLGPARTLVLVDGQRHVAADPGSFAVDLGSIPPALVDRVEVVTGGASAIYGSDALAGVVNIILKKNFVGVQGQEQAGFFPEGQHGSYGTEESGYLTVGHNFLSDRLNVNATLIWDNNAQILTPQVEGQHNFGLTKNPLTNGKTKNGFPRFIVTPNVESDFINNTGVLFDAASGALNTFTAGGTLIPQQARTGSNSFAFGSFAPDCLTCFRGEDYALLQPKTDRIGGDVRLSFDITPHINFNVDEKLIQREIYDFNQPSISFFSFVLPPDNAFITPAIRAATSEIVAPPGACGPFASTSLNCGAILVNRFLGDGGPRLTFARRLTERVVPQFRGDFDAHFAQINWDATFNFGESINDLSNRRIELPGNFAASIDSVIDPATGKPACRINVPSAVAFGAGFNNPPSGLVGPASACVPYNPFGLQNSRAAILYSRTNEVEHQRLEQDVATLNANFDTSRFFNLPGGAIGIAAGVEWRREHVTDNQDPLVKQGLTEIAQVPDFTGGFEVTEEYIEASFPVFKHSGPLLDELTFDVADRNANYSTVGDVNAWKVSGVWGPFPGLKFRADYSEAVRAPNLTEAFLPPSGTFFTVVDPCDANSIGSGGSNRFKNCAALLAALGAPPAGTFVDTAVNLSPPGIITGNQNLTPERSKSYTIGLVLNPTWEKNFSLTVDYYNIDIQQAILEPSANQLADNCVDGPTLDPTFCNLVSRAPNNGFVNSAGQIDAVGDISFIKDTFINASRLFTDGVEVQGNYVFWMDPWHLRFSRDSDLPGKVTVGLDFNWLMHLHDFPFQKAPNIYIVEEGTLVPAGFEATPYQRARADITYDQGPWSATWTVRYVGRAADFNRSPGRSAYAGNAIFPPYIPAQFYNDITVHYKLPTWKGTTDLFVGAQDLFNKVPPPNVVTGNNGGPDGSGLYDLGLFLFAGAKVRY